MKIITFVSFVLLAVFFGIAAYMLFSPLMGYLSGVCTVMGAVVLSRENNIKKNGGNYYG